MLKILITSLVCLVANFGFAQSQILKYDDLQTLIQGKPETVNSFLKQKNYHIQPGFSPNEVRAFNLFADDDYTDVLVTFAKHNTIQLITTNSGQTNALQKSLQNFRSKESKGIVKYQVKDGIISRVDVKAEKSGNISSLKYTFLLEN